MKLYETESFVPKAAYSYKCASGDGFIEMSKNINTTLAIDVTIKVPGNYSIDIRYANGNGPVNTENKCDRRTLKINGLQKGTFVFHSGEKRSGATGDLAMQF